MKAGLDTSQSRCVGLHQHPRHEAGRGDPRNRHPSAQQLGQRTCSSQIYDGLDAGERCLARNAFLRLTALGQGTEDTRRRVPPAELLAGPDGAAMEAVLSRLTAARLLTVDEDSVQVAHEAVIRS